MLFKLNTNFLQYKHLLRLSAFLHYIIVMPFDGSTTGWWLDSPVDSLSQLSQWLSGEFKALIDSHYAPLPDGNTTGIAGHSMGGYGALLNYKNHFDTYEHVFSAKGVLEIMEHRGAYGAASVLGAFASGERLYQAVDLPTLIPELTGKRTNILFYSGPNDWFTDENRRFDSLLTVCNLRHHYFESQLPPAEVVA